MDQLAGVVAALVLLHVSVALIAHMTMIRIALRNAAQPDWDGLYDSLWDLLASIGPGSTVLARVTMPLGRRLWPPVTGCGNGGGSV